MSCGNVVGPNPTERGKKWKQTRHLLVDARGVPLSLVVNGANVHGSKGFDTVLSGIVVKRKNPPHKRNKHWCADAGYRGAQHLRTIEDHGYIAHAVGRKKEADIKRRNPNKKAMRWVVEVCHS